MFFYWLTLPVTGRSGPLEWHRQTFALSRTRDKPHSGIASGVFKPDLISTLKYYVTKHPQPVLAGLQRLLILSEPIRDN